MSTKVNDTQLMLLSAAFQRHDHCLAPSASPKRSLVQRAVANLLEARLVKEIRAKAGAPIWRRDKETGRAYALKLTAAGAKVIAVDGTPPLQEEAERRVGQLVGMADPESEPGSNPAATVSRPDGGAAPIPIPPRNGTKVAEVIALLQRGDGATLAELVAATGWLPHTTRAALTGLRKRGYAIDRTHESRGSVYRIEWREVADSVARAGESTLADEALSDRPDRSARQRSRQAA
jgi:hypothetical protein